MKKHLPSKTGLVVFAVLSLILAAVAFGASSTDVVMAVVSVPLFVGCALLGMHRSGRLIPVRQEVRVRK